MGQPFHVGMVFEDHSNNLFLAHSATTGGFHVNDLRDALTQRVKEGQSITVRRAEIPSEQYKEMSARAVFFCRAHSRHPYKWPMAANVLGTEGGEQMRQTLTQLSPSLLPFLEHVNTRERQREEDRVMLDRLLLPGRRHGHGYFCSQAVAELYKHMQLIPEDFTSENTLPVTLMNEGTPFSQGINGLTFKPVEKLADEIKTPTLAQMNDDHGIGNIVRLLHDTRAALRRANGQPLPQAELDALRARFEEDAVQSLLRESI